VDIGPFLKEEKKLIETIADRLGHFMVYKQMERVVHEWQSASKDLSENSRSDWEAVLDLLRQTDNALFLSIANKMLNHLCWSGITEAKDLRLKSEPYGRNGVSFLSEEAGRPHTNRILDFSTEFIEQIFSIASHNLSDDEILSRIQMWIQEDRLSHLVQIVQRHLSLSEVMDALRRYFCTAPFEADAKYPVSKGLKVSLIRRILSDEVDYINLLKQHVEIEDLYHLLENVIFSPESHGKLGRRSSAFFLASQILENAKTASEPLNFLQIPKTWYISSDMMLHFMHYNHIDEIIEQKYKEIERIRLEYPHIVQTFTHSAFPPDMVRAMSMALDGLGDVPLIVRSSSLLDERSGKTFTGEYQSVFVINRGPKQERLAELMQAVAQVYASAFSVDPIEYRAEQTVLDFSEEMGIMIQEAVGTRVGPYFLPAYTGSALSWNDFRWSHQLERDDGLVRIVPGLGARCSINHRNPHPVLFSPGQPGLKVNASEEEARRFAPKTLDLINLETRSIETVDISGFLKTAGNLYPQMKNVFSLYKDGSIEPLSEASLNTGDDELLATFDSLIERSPFVVQLRRTLRLLEEKMGGPVHLRFASDGESVYLLECCRQRHSVKNQSASIPRDIPADERIFHTHRSISDGRIQGITHIVYIDPEAYKKISDENRYNELAEVLKKLNELLPKKQFMVVSPHPWKGRDNKKPEGTIPFSLINHTAFLAEIFAVNEDARVEPSFRTPYYHDLVKSEICYLPLYPEQENTGLNEAFLKGAKNMLEEILPEFAHLTDLIRLIDITQSKEGKVLEVLMNTDLGETAAVLRKRETDSLDAENKIPVPEMHPENYWRWRHGMAAQVAAELDAARFGVKGFYLFGSTKNGTAGPGSDIDILIHFQGNDSQREQLELWLEGWSLCLDEMNYLQTGYRSKGLLDVHIITDKEIAEKSSYAVKINAVTDAAKSLKMKVPAKSGESG